MVRTYEQEQATNVRQQKREQPLIPQEIQSQINVFQEKLQNTSTLTDYEKQYNQIPDNLKQYFFSPSELSTRVSSQNVQVLSQVDTEIKKVKDKLQQIRENYNTEKNRIESRYSGERLKEQLQNLKDNKRYDDRYYGGYLEALEESKQRLNEGSVISLDNITTYAKQKAKSEGMKEIYREERRDYRAETPQLVSGDLADIEKSIKEFEKANPTERVVRDNQGNVVGITSGILKKSFSDIEAYQKELSSRTNKPSSIFLDTFKPELSPIGQETITKMKDAQLEALKGRTLTDIPELSFKIGLGEKIEAGLESIPQRILDPFSFNIKRDVTSPVDVNQLKDFNRRLDNYQGKTLNEVKEQLRKDTLSVISSLKETDFTKKREDPLTFKDTIGQSLSWATEYYEQELSKKKLDKYSKAVDQLKNLNTLYEGGKLDNSDYQLYYNAIINYPEFQKLETEVKRFVSLPTNKERARDIVKDYPVLRNVVEASMSAAQVLPYQLPGYRALAGFGLGVSSGIDFGKAIRGDSGQSTSGLVASGVAKAGLGTTLAISGVRASSPRSTGVGFAQRYPRLTLGAGTSLIGGVSALSGVQTFKETGKIDLAISSAIGTAGGLVGPEIYRRATSDAAKVKRFNKEIVDKKIKGEEYSEIRQINENYYEISTRSFNRGTQLNQETKLLLYSDGKGNILGGEAYTVLTEKGGRIVGNPITIPITGGKVNSNLLVRAVRQESLGKTIKEISETIQGNVGTIKYLINGQEKTAFFKNIVENGIEDYTRILSESSDKLIKTLKVSKDGITTSTRFNPTTLSLGRNVDFPSSYQFATPVDIYGAEKGLSLLGRVRPTEKSTSFFNDFTNTFTSGGGTSTGGFTSSGRGTGLVLTNLDKTTAQLSQQFAGVGLTVPRIVPPQVTTQFAPSLAGGTSQVIREQPATINQRPFSLFAPAQTQSFDQFLLPAQQTIPIQRTSARTRQEASQLPQSDVFSSFNLLTNQIVTPQVRQISRQKPSQNQQAQQIINLQLLTQQVTTPSQRVVFGNILLTPEQQKARSKKKKTKEEEEMEGLFPTLFQTQLLGERRARGVRRTTGLELIR